VGFLSKEHETDASLLDGRYIRVVDLYTNADDDIARRILYHQKYGYAKAVLVAPPNTD
jgi:hypothetical protein